MRIIERKLLPELISWLDKPEIIVITGSRQVGKTTLLNMMLQKIPSNNKVYFDLEDYTILDICNSGASNFMNYLNLQGYSTEQKLYIAIDEIQYLNDPSNFLKILHDHYPSVKLIVSGSSTMEIKKKFKDSLTGRKIIFELDSFSFDEFLLLKYESLYKVKQRIGNIKSILEGEFKNDMKLLINDFSQVVPEYIIWGGYPRNLHEHENSVKIALIKEIYNSYVRRDIKDIAQIGDISAFNNLIRLLADQISGQINYNELSNTLGNNLLTIKKYLFLLENTFIISRCQPYSKNKRKEISKMPKIFFQDTGLRNAVIDNFSMQITGMDWGNLLENFIFNELRRHFKPGESLFYWRTLAGAEVDFVLINENRKPVPVEVKATALREAKVSRSFRSFINTYQPDTGLIFNNSFVTKADIDGCMVYFLPHFAT